MTELTWLALYTTAVFLAGCLVPWILLVRPLEREAEAYLDGWRESVRQRMCLEDDLSALTGELAAVRGENDSLRCRITAADEELAEIRNELSFLTVIE